MPKSKHVLELTDESFDVEVLKSDLPVLVDFWAEWCGPCRSMAPVIDKLGEKYAGKVRVAKLDIDRHASIPERYEIQSIPTFMVFKDGKMEHEIAGAVPQAKLEQVLAKVLK